MTSIAISAVAAWFSVLGLTQIFAAAFLPVAIMGGVLELGKVVAAVWTHHYWKELNLLTKSLLVPIIGLLMIVTSLGIFGLLSKGHPLGATGIANIYEVCTHLRGEAGERQVEGARLGMTHVIGLGTACGIHILEKV